MKKRLLAGILWFLTGWMVGSMAAYAFGLSSALAPILAFAAAAIIVGDPRRIIWSVMTPRIEARIRSASQVPAL